MSIIMKMIISLFAFLREIFLANPTYQNVVRRNKHLLIVSGFCLILFFTLLFSIEKGLILLREYEKLENEHTILFNKYTIMTNLYGENASEDPDIIVEVFECREKILLQQETIETQTETLLYNKDLIEYLQRQVITSSGLCE